MVALSSWTNRRMADGFALYPREGREAGIIRVQRNVMPLARMSDQAAAMRRRLDRLARVAVESEDVFATADGEYAAHTVLSAVPLRDGPPFEINLSAVFGDHFYTRVEAVCYRAELFDSFRNAVRYIAYNTSLGLGPVRQRPYRYTPPPGWGGLPVEQGVQWIPPGVPDDWASIVVRHADPQQTTPKAVLDRVVAEAQAQGVRLVRTAEPEPVATEHGLSGLISSWAGERQNERTLHDVAVLVDYRFAYVQKLETREDTRERHFPTFIDLVESCHPLPPSGASATNVLFDWTPL